MTFEYNNSTTPLHLHFITLKCLCVVVSCLLSQYYACWCWTAGYKFMSGFYSKTLNFCFVIKTVMSIRDGM